MFHFLPQAVNVRFNRMGCYFGVIVPNVLQQIVFGNDFIF